MWSILAKDGICCINWICTYIVLKWICTDVFKMDLHKYGKIL